MKTSVFVCLMHELNYKWYFHITVIKQRILLTHPGIPLMISVVWRRLINWWSEREKSTQNLSYCKGQGRTLVMTLMKGTAEKETEWTEEVRWNKRLGINGWEERDSGRNKREQTAVPETTLMPWSAFCFTLLLVGYISGGMEFSTVKTLK